jgi:2-C-methyl-D-erythritol 2,4-cyclodiphosphate synthase
MKKPPKNRSAGGTRIGFGYDIHAFGAGRKLILGGVRIPFQRGLLGHSDADVLIHAICDALLGAAALGDIGRHFPDTNKKYRNISSVKLLELVRSFLAGGGYTLVNVDSTVVLERPIIAPYAARMVKRIAKALRINKNQVSVKATTNEGMGSVGRGAACAAYAVASIKLPDGQ